jgi:hypothetical protein
LFGNRWLMSALPPIAHIDQTIADVRFVPILLQKSAISRTLRLSLVVLSRQLPPVPLGAVP